MARLEMIGLGLALLWMATACGSGDGESLGTSGSSSGNSSSSSGEVADPLPCELGSMLDNLCGQCHGVEPAFDALRSLVSHSDLTSSGDGHDTLAEACITRMRLPQSDEERMPLTPRPTATQAEIGLVEDFVSAGFPMGTSETCP